MKNRLYANVCTWAEKITKNKISKLLLLWKVSKNIFFNSNSLFYFSAFCIHVCICVYGCVYVCTPWIEPWNFTFIIIFFFSHRDVFCLQALFFFSLAFHTHTTYEKGSIHSFFLNTKRFVQAIILPTDDDTVSSKENEKREATANNINNNENNSSSTSSNNRYQDYHHQRSS